MEFGSTGKEENENLIIHSAVLLTLRGLLWSAYEPTSKKVCEVGRPKCVFVVIKRWSVGIGRSRSNATMIRCLPSSTCEPPKHFCRHDEIGYDDPASVIREDALFANYYFRAYNAYHSGVMSNVPSAWRGCSTHRGRSVRLPVP